MKEIFYFIFSSYLKFNLWNGIEVFLKEEKSYPLVSFMGMLFESIFPDEEFEIDEIKENPPDKEEIEKILLSFYGRNLRFHQSKINQAYFMSFYEYLGAGYEYDLKIFEILKNYLKKEDFGIVIVG